MNDYMNKKRKTYNNFNKKFISAIEIENFFLKTNFLKKNEFIWNLLIERKYKNVNNKINIYHEPHKDTALKDKFLIKNEIVKINVVYFDNNKQWYKLSDGRGWILIN
jgi:hypothetical protein